MFRIRRGRRLAIAAIGVFTLLSGGAAAVFWLLRQTPCFYHEVEALKPDECSARSKEFVQESSRLWNQIQNQEAWVSIFRQEQVNAWLASDFTAKHGDVLPEGISRPQLEFDRGRLRMAFQLRRGPVTVILSTSGHVWVPHTNLLAVEFEKVRVGRLPVTPSCVVEPLSSAAHSVGMEIQWRRRARNLVALVHLTGLERSRRGIELESLELRSGMLMVAGQCRSSARLAQDPSVVSQADSAEVSRKDHVPESSLRR